MGKEYRPPSSSLCHILSKFLFNPRPHCATYEGLHYWCCGLNSAIDIQQVYLGCTEFAFFRQYNVLRKSVHQCHVLCEYVKGQGVGLSSYVVEFSGHGVSVTVSALVRVVTNHNRHVCNLCALFIPCITIF